MPGTRLTFANGQPVEQIEECDHPEGFVPRGDGLNHCPECKAVRIPE